MNEMPSWIQITDEFEDMNSRGKRGDPNYSQVSGYINKDVALQFKIVCTAKEISQSEALEEAIAAWLKANPLQDVLKQ